MITEKAYGKINLTLHVGDKRVDGYHEIDSLMHTIDLADDITLERQEGISLSVSGENVPDGPDNLMVKAAEVFFRMCGLKGCGAAMTLRKRIPTESGLGGGSADAAAVLRGLNRLYETQFSLPVLARLGRLVGADVPFLVSGGAARCRGIGEKLTPFSAWAGLPLLLVKPPVSVATPEAYRLFDAEKGKCPPRTGDALRALEVRDGNLLAESLFNDFEESLFPSVPALGQVKEAFREYGAVNLMTGSGSAFFLLFRDGKKRKETGERIRAEHPEWTVIETQTIDPFPSGSC